jgi:hypothetical protein
MFPKCLLGGTIDVVNTLLSPDENGVPYLRTPAFLKLTITFSTRKALCVILLYFSVSTWYVYKTTHTPNGK